MRTILAILIVSLVAFTAHGSPEGTTARPQAVGWAGQAGLAKQRALQLERLHLYRLAGQFTTDDAGLPASVFRDHAGRLCPMAYLIASSGRIDLVDQVARDNNTLQLADITEGPLWDWMLTSGLTREEIIRIQGAMRIGYDFERPRGERGPTIMALEQPPTPAQL